MIAGKKFVIGMAMVTEECAECHMFFAVSQDFQDRRIKDHKGFFCPNGHSLYYPKIKKKKDDTPKP